MNTHFDYIIAGAGCSGLTMAWQLKEVLQEHETVLVVDKKCADENDRTWAFWTKECGWIKDFKHYEWGNLTVKNNTKTIQFNTGNYTYYMIRCAEYYNKITSALKHDYRYCFVTEEVTNITSDNHLAYLSTNSGLSYTCKWLFNSCFPGIRNFKAAGHNNLIQQFCGFYIETEDISFHKNNITFMDFSTPQNGITSFAYVLPLSEKTALVEYVTMAIDFLPVIRIKGMLKTYVHEHLQINNYTITNEECGWIPMTDGRFNPKLGDKVINIGIVGGAIKPSTGYTFLNTQKQINALVEAIRKRKIPIAKKSVLSKRFDLYDATFLYLLNKHPHKGAEILTSLFERNKGTSILKFLNNETSVTEELKIFCSVDFSLFIPAILNVLTQRLKTKKPLNERLLNEVYS